ncbi:MAG: Ig-like domain-containing protein [Candidatus Levybacteria bacterium]|nr:Ig-like domain-containing protein [Candidatus Levybacteria bacterium]
MDPNKNAQSPPPSPKGIGEIPVSEIEKLHQKPNVHLKQIVKTLLILLGVFTVVLLGVRTVDYFSGGKEKNFVLSESSPINEQTVVSVIDQPTFVFSEKLQVGEKDLNNFFKIEPNVSGSWHMEKNKQVVYFSSDKKQKDSLSPVLSYNTLYTVTIKQTLKASNGKQLKKDIAIAFRTEQNPSFGISPNKKLYITSPDTPVVADFFRTDSFDNRKSPSQSTYTVTIQKATVEQLLNYFSYIKVSLPFYSFTPTSDDKTLTSFQSTISNNQYDQPFFTLPPFTKTGIYFVTVKNQHGQEDFFVNSTNAITQVFNSDDVLYTWTEHAKTGESVLKTSSEFYRLKKSPALLDTQKSGENGMAKTTKNPNDIDLVIVKAADDITVTKTSSYYRLESASSSQLPTTYAYTDRPIYRPGDTIHYKAMYIRLATSYMETGSQQYKEVNLDANGTVTGDFVLPESIIGATPRIILASKDTKTTKTDDDEESQENSPYRTIHSLDVNVQSYRKPDLDISIETAKKEYISTDQANFTLTAKTLYGQPFGNIPFTYRVITNPYTEYKDRENEQLATMLSTSYYGSGEALVSGNGVFDKNGQTKISFSTNLNNLEDSQIATIEITPKIGAAPSIGKTAILIHRGEFGLFFDDVKASTKSGVLGTIAVLNHDTPRKPMGNKEITISLLKADPQNYQNKTFVEKTQTIADQNGIAQFRFEKVEEGSYEIVATATDPRQNIVTSRYSLFVTKGSDAEYSSSGTGSILSVTTDKKNYLPGETATVKVVSQNDPITDVAFITTNTSSLDLYRSSPSITSVTVKKAENNTVSIQIPIPSLQVTPLGITVFTVSNNKVLSQQISLEINNKKKQLKTSITFDKKVVKPKDTVMVTIETKTADGKPVSSDTSLSIIDAAVEQVQQVSGDIFDTFYGYQYAPFVKSYDSSQGIYAQMGGGGGGGCFLAGTAIRTADGKTKPIEKIQIGEAILTRDSQISNTLVKDTVTKTYRHIVDEYLTINDRLKITPVHRLLVNGVWKQASEIHVGDRLVDEQGNDVLVTTITAQKGNFVVYNLSIEKRHTFFAEGIYVHNDKGPAPRQNFIDTAYWNPHIKTDTFGKATISFTVPDNLTTFSAYTFANTKTTDVGQAQAQIISQKPITIIPTLPNFFYQFDSAVVSGLIQNSTKSPVTMSVTFSVKELKNRKTQEYTIQPGDFESISFPIELQTTSEKLTFILEANEKNSGKQLDAVEVTKNILPRGNIETAWMSFTGSKTLMFSPKYPEFDFDSYSISLAPHIANSLLQSEITLDQSLSSRLGQQLYTAAVILYQTQNGRISPSVFQYAHMKNSFRESLQIVLKNKVTRKELNNKTLTYWVNPYTGDSDTVLATTLWLIKALEKIDTTSLASDVSGIPALIEQAKEYTSTLKGSDYLPPSPVIMEETNPENFPYKKTEKLPIYPPSTDSADLKEGSSSKGVLAVSDETPFEQEETEIPEFIPQNSRGFVPPPQENKPMYGYTTNEQLLLFWVLKKEPATWKSFEKTPSFIAVKALNGDKKAIEKLKTLKVESAEDRYLWDGSSPDDILFPVLAMVEVGTKEDATKAIKGLSILYNGYTSYYDNALSILAGVEHALSQNLSIEKPHIAVFINGDIHYQTDDKKNNYYQSYAETLSPTQEKNGKLEVRVDASGSLPVFTTVIETQYTTGVQNTKPWMFWESILSNFFSKTDAKISQNTLKRQYLDIQTGNPVKMINNGQTGVVDISFTNPFRNGANSSYTTLYSISMEDAISPAFMYLDQQSGNSPQYQNSLDTLFSEKKMPSESNTYIYSPISYLSPFDYSDQTVFFSGIPPDTKTVHMPYVVYGINPGSYYQPKTNIVFPNLGLIMKER